MKLSFHFMIQEFKMETLKFTTITKTVTFHILAQANIINREIEGWIDNYNYFGTTTSKLIANDFSNIILNAQINKIGYNDRKVNYI